MGDNQELISFTSLGMLILDQVHLPGGKVVENVMGGSGCYGKCSDLAVCQPVLHRDTMKILTGTASLGARLFLPKTLSTRVGWTIRTGYDFPIRTLRQLETWGITLSVVQEDKCPSTRGQLKYLDSTFASNASTSVRQEF